MNQKLDRSASSVAPRLPPQEMSAARDSVPGPLGRPATAVWVQEWRAENQNTRPRSSISEPIKDAQGRDGCAGRRRGVGLDGARRFLEGAVKAADGAWLFKTCG